MKRVLAATNGAFDAIMRPCQPATRMIVILGVVAAVTFCSALLFQSPALKRIYRLDRQVRCIRQREPVEVLCWRS